LTSLIYVVKIQRTLETKMFFTFPDCVMDGDTTSIHYLLYLIFLTRWFQKYYNGCNNGLRLLKLKNINRIDAQSELTGWVGCITYALE